MKKWLRNTAVALGIAAGAFGLTQAATLSPFTGPAGTNPINFPAGLADMNSLINTISPVINQADVLLYSLSTTPVGTLSGTALQGLATYALPAGQLSAVGQHLRIIATFKTAANTNTKTPVIYFGGETFTGNAVTAASTVERLEMDVLKTGASAQTYSGVGWSSTAVIPLTSSTTTETDTSTINIYAGCTDGSSSANDCLLQDFTVEQLGL